MSLDVYLMQDSTAFPIAADLCEENGFVAVAQFLKEYEPKRLYEANITHNLNKMATEAGIYEVLWRPEEINVRYAKELVPLLESGLMKLKSNPEYYHKFSPKNGWGTYEGLVNFVECYLAACKAYPNATIEVSR